MKAILKNGQEYDIENMVESYFENTNAEEEKHTVSFGVAGDMEIETLRDTLTPENLASVTFQSDVKTVTMENLKLRMISKSVNDAGCSTVVRLSK